MRLCDRGGGEPESTHATTTSRVDLALYRARIPGRKGEGGKGSARKHLGGSRGTVPTKAEDQENGEISLLQAMREKGARDQKGQPALRPADGPCGKDGHASFGGGEDRSIKH